MSRSRSAQGMPETAGSPPRRPARPRAGVGARPLRAPAADGGGLLLAPQRLDDVVRTLRVVEVELVAALKSSWSLRRRLVSSMARVIDGVTWSAYMTTWPSTLRAARPMVWTREVSERRNPSLSASRMATRVTSGRSRPSRSRLIPTRVSNSPRRRSRRISMRCTVSISECR